jgi:hypothetical protein
LAADVHPGGFATKFCTHQAQETAQAEEPKLRATSKEVQTAQSHADDIDDEISHTPKTRRCLMCHTQFESTWAGERVCRQCKSSSQWRSGALG